jgi:hypothetical protein
VSDESAHDAGCPGIAHSDAAKRCSDEINLHLAALGFEAFRKWVAVRLADGGSDKALYDSKRDAVRHQADEQLCAYVCIPPTRMSVCSAEAFLSFTRRAYKAGFRLPDPDSRTGGPDVIRRLTTKDQAMQANALPPAFR